MRIVQLFKTYIQLNMYKNQFLPHRKQTLCPLQRPNSYCYRGNRSVVAVRNMCNL